MDIKDYEKSNKEECYVKNMPNGMEINDIYRFENNGVNYYVYEGLCDNKKPNGLRKQMGLYNKNLS